MEIIEEIAFTISGQKCTYKLYKYEEEIVQKVKKPANIGEVTQHMGYKYVDAKIRITKYALHQEFEGNGEFKERLICETEVYATILTILKGVLLEYIETINKWQSPKI